MWKKLEAKDWQLVDKYVELVNCADDTVNTLFLLMWRNINNLEFIVEEKWMIVKGNYDGKTFIYRPLALRKDMVEAFKRAEELMEGEYEVIFVHKSVEKLIVDNFPVKKITPDHDIAEYIYPVRQFITFAGRAMQKKRNHLNNFKRRYANANVVVKVVGNEDIEPIRNFVTKWDSEHNESQKDDYYKVEMQANNTLIDELEIYCPPGIVIYIDGKVEAYSFVTTRCDLGVCNIEKANQSIRGLYQFLQKQIAWKFWNKPGIKWISREDDGGNEMLRKSKASYKPVWMAERSIVKWR